MVETCRTGFFDKSIARMISVSAGASAVILILFEILQSGECLQCYQCGDQLRPGETSACLTGDVTQLKQVHCTEPSECISLQSQTIISGVPLIIHVIRDCQPLRLGRCKDKKKKTYRLLCSTCKTDLCNSSSKIKTIPLVLTMIYALPWLYI